MLTTYPNKPAHARRLVWIDLFEPTLEELAQASRDLGADLPPRQEISSIALSKRMHSSARLRNVSGLIRISSGPGEDRGVLRQNSAAISASFGFSSGTDRAVIDRLSSSARQGSQCLPADDGEVPSPHAGKIVEASPLDPTANLAGSLG